MHFAMMARRMLRAAKEPTMASNQPDPKRDESGQSAKDKPVPAKPGTADKPAGKPALKGPLQRPEKA